jgi:integrase
MSLLRQRVVVYHTPEGKRCPKAEAVTTNAAGKPVLRPGYRKVRSKSAKWYGQYVDAQGVRRRVPLSTDKTAARQMLNELVKRAELGKAGILDPFEEHRKRPLAEHLADWEAVLLARKNAGVYVRVKVNRARKVIEACKFARIADLSASRVEACLAEFRTQPRFGTQTSNHYLQAIKQFARWLVTDRRTAENPLSHLQAGNVRLDRRHERRDLSDAELAYLFENTRGARPVRRLPGPDRELLYLVSVYTGLRASELASLTPKSFDLDADPPTVVVEAAYSKHRREDVVPLHPDLVARLHPWLAGRPRGERLWPGQWAKGKDGGVMLKMDLKRARAAWIAEAPDGAERERREGSSFLAYRDEGGRVADFHALRHTFITRLVRAGVKPKEAQALARHSTITLTMDRYAHTGLHDVAAAVGTLPSLPRPDGQADQQALRATGTEGPAYPFAYTKLTQTADVACESLRANETGEVGAGGQETGSGAVANPLILQAFAADCDPMRGGESEPPEGTPLPGAKKKGWVSEAHPFTDNRRGPGVAPTLLRPLLRVPARSCLSPSLRRHSSPASLHPSPATADRRGNIPN